MRSENLWMSRKMKKTVINRSAAILAIGAIAATLFPVV